MALAGRKGVELNAATLAQYDAVLIATDHDDVDYKMIVDNAKLVVDTRNACERAGLTGGNIVKS
jgi:UDP-N-acetyl-D-glucosamine dehydrogenase